MLPCPGVSPSTCKGLNSDLRQGYQWHKFMLICVCRTGLERAPGFSTSVTLILPLGLNHPAAPSSSCSTLPHPIQPSLCHFPSPLLDLPAPAPLLLCQHQQEGSSFPTSTPGSSAAAKHFTTLLCQHTPWEHAQTDSLWRLDVGSF